MKITPDHYEVLSSAINSAAQGYLTLKEYQSANFTAKMWRWDLLHRAQRLNLMPDRFVIDTLYPYVNDNHIDTALRRITATS